MNVKEMFSTILSAFEGLTFKEIMSGVIWYAPENLRDLWKNSRDDFDKQYGTDTSKSVASCDLNPITKNTNGAVMYWPTHTAALDPFLEAIGSRAKGFTFVDIGAGKGKVQMLAADNHFSKLIGVEFSPTLCEIAKENFKKFKSVRKKTPPMSIECADAATWTPPPDPLFIYLFDPFAEEIMSRFVENLISNLKENPRPCYIAYLLPTQENELLRRGFQVVARRGRNWKFDYPWAIYSYPERKPRELGAPLVHTDLLHLKEARAHQEMVAH